ncbi:MAG TPA: phospholipase A2 [Acidimicrobiales bacterium]
MSTIEATRTTHRSLRLGAKLLLTAALVVGGLTFAAPAQPAAAHTPHPTNGCSNSPDRPYGFNFRTSCDWHDVCYGHTTYGRSANGRHWCDYYFYGKLANWCRANLTNNAGWHNTWSGYGWKYLLNPETTCLNTAGTYYWAVRNYGCHSFWNDGKPFYERCPADR